MNIVKAIFSGGCTQITAAEALWQWDQGQILQIVGLDLPDAYQVEFSNQPVRGAAAPMIGGVSGVEIPDVYLTTGRDIYAFVVLHSGETDRETEYRITIHVNARPQPTDVQPTPEQQGVIDQLIAALNAGVDRAEDAADEAEGSAGNAAAQAQAAAQSAISSASSASDAAAQAGLAATAKAGAEAAQAAAETAQGSAEAFAAAAGAAKAAAETAQGKAEDAQTAAEAAQAAAESAKAGALAAKAAAETAQGKAEDAQEAAEQAAQDAHVEYEQLAGQVTAQGQTIAQHGQAIAQNTEDIADLDTELTRQKSAIEALEALTNHKAGALIDTASGAIASFVPDATVPNLLGLTVDIEPVQDLHGYDSPWPGGGGKNLFRTTATTGTVNGTTFTVNDDGTIRVSGTPSAIINGGYVFGEVTLPAGTYKVNGNDFPTDRLRITVYNVTAQSAIASFYNNYDISFTLSEESVIRVYPFVHTYYDGTETTLKPMIRLASVTDATYAPYENICPISGWDAVEVPNTSTNIWDEEWELGGLVNATGLPYNATDRIRSKNFCGCKPSTAFFKCSGDAHVNAFWYDSNKAFISRDTTIANSVITSPSNAAFFKLVDTDRINYADNISINYPATDHAYHPYAGNRYVIQLGDTVYGGTLDVTAGTLTVDREAVDLGTLTWTKNESSLIGLPCFTATLPGVKPGAPYFNCSEYAIKRDRDAINGTAQISPGNGSNATYCVVRDDRYAGSTAADFKSAVSGVTLVYPLASPVVIQLDPVTVPAIPGQSNNVWADAGDVSVEFAADLKHYIDSKIAAAVAAMS